jgi:hypothetical protein
MSYGTAYEALYYAVFFSLLPFHLASDQVLSSTPSSPTSSIYVPPLIGSETVQNRTRTHVQFLLRMTSDNNDLSSWDTFLFSGKGMNSLRMTNVRR